MKSKIYIGSSEAHHLMASPSIEGIRDCTADIENNSLYDMYF